MKIIDFAKKYKSHAIVGGIAGVINGLLGAGGGIILTYFLSASLSDEQKRSGGVFANAVATMLPISVFSFGLYLQRGYFKFDSGFLRLIIPAIIGGTLGAFLLSRVRADFLKLAFSILVIVSGISMIFR